jgi:hypothetical protein
VLRYIHPFTRIKGEWRPPATPARRPRWGRRPRSRVRADLVMLDLRRAAFAPRNDLLQQAVYA